MHTVALASGPVGHVVKEVFIQANALVGD